MHCWVREETGLRQLFRNEFPTQLMENGRWYSRFDVTDLQDHSVIGYLYQPIVVQEPNVPEEFELAKAIRAAKSLGTGVTLSFNITPSPLALVEKGSDIESTWKAAEEVRDVHRHYNETIGQSVRQLALAGIAVVWLFKLSSSNAINLPRSFVMPLLLFVITLTLDFMHVALGSLLFGRSISALLTRWSNPQGLSGLNKLLYRKEEIQGAVLLGSPALRVLFWTRVVTLALGYFLLIMAVSKFTTLI